MQRYLKENGLRELVTRELRAERFDFNEFKGIGSG